LLGEPHLLGENLDRSWLERESSPASCSH
jgi:hypothetical protein